MEAQIALGIKGLKEDREQLAEALKRRPLPWEIYLAHQQGVKGAESLIGADPDANAASIAGKEAIAQNGGSADTTVGQFLEMTQNLFLRKSMLFSDQGLPSAQGVRENYAAGLDAVTRTAEREHPGDPRAVERYRSFYIQQAGQTLHAQQITDRANRELLSAGLAGPNGAKSWGHFLSDPKRAQAYAESLQTDPDISGRVDRAISANATDTWDPAASDETDALHKALTGMQTTDRDKFEDTDLMQYYGGMPAVQLNELLNEQRRLRRRDPGADEKQIGMVRALSVLRPVIAQAGLTPEAATYNGAVGKLDLALRQWRANHNNTQPDDTEIMQIGLRTLFPRGAPGGR